VVNLPVQFKNSSAALTQQKRISNARQARKAIAAVA
jgi:hypothetical protein